MKRYELVHNICGEKYREFILYCLKHANIGVQGVQTR